MHGPRFIIHVDMDAFFAAIEQRDNPQLAGRPVVVGADPKNGRGRGVVSTCSYEARRFGVHSAQPISQAFAACPQAVFLPVDMEHYQRVSAQLYALFSTCTPEIEPVSIDEAFLDISTTYKLFGTPYQAAVALKERIRRETSLTASVGLAPTKMAAKIASDLRKPDGLVEVRAENLYEFLRPLTVDKLWGVGNKTKVALEGMGIVTIGDLARRRPQELVKAFGKSGWDLWQLANGIDPRQVEVESEAKSISNELTFERDTQDSEQINAGLISLCEQVSERLRSQGLKARTISLKVRLEGFQTYTRAKTLSEPTNFYDLIYYQIQQLFRVFRQASPKRKIRLVGVKASNLSSGALEGNLFPDPKDNQREGVHQAVEVIRAKFGEGSIYHAAGRQMKRR